MIRIVVSVFIVYAVTELGRSFIMTVTQMNGNKTAILSADIGKSFIYGEIAGIAFGSAGNIRYGLRQRNSCFRHSDKLYCLHSCHSDNKCLRVGIADIFGSADGNTAGYKIHIFTGGKHSCQIMNGSIRVAAAHAFDKSGDYVIMIVAVFIIFLNTFTDNGIYNTFINPIIVFAGNIACLFQNVESNAGITAGELSDCRQCFFITFKILSAKSPFFI